MAEEVLQADLTWTGIAFEEGVQVVVDDGRIRAVGRLGREPGRRLRRRALLPGFVNAHSHAFQRGLRGRAETYPASPGNFWSWRESMYELAASLDAGAFFELCLAAFREMRAAGITAVGEFHYLHHAGDGDFALDERVLEAASRAGIRLVLLEAYYRTGGVGQPLAGAQRRFATDSPEVYWRQMDRLARQLDPELQTLGAVVQSLRAAAPEEIAKIHAEARRRGLVFHMHVEEQRREIEDCVAAYGEPPLQLLNERLEISPTFTAVHLTHSDEGDLERFVRAGGNACICPTTEGNLGDGIPDLPLIHAENGALCLGSDSNVRISMLEEVRWLEYVQRLARERRGILRDGTGNLAVPLLAAATAGGARSLGLAAGEIAPGRLADFAAVDLDAPTLAGTDADTLAAALLFGAAEEAIAATCVGGRWQEHRQGGCTLRSID